MKVVAFNGSPKAKGNTYHAIRMVADELEKEYGKEFIDRVLKLKSSASFKAMQFAPIVKVGTKPLSFREKWFEV